MTNTETPASARPIPATLLLITAAFMPFSLNIGLHFTASKKDLYLSPLDILAPVLLLLGLFHLLKTKSDTPLSSRVTASIPLANLALFCWALLSFTWGRTLSPGINDWARNAVFQVGLSGFVAVWVFGNGLNAPALARKATLILSTCIGLCFLYALFQYVQPAGKLVTSIKDIASSGGVSNYRVAGWYDYRGQFGGQIAMLVPVFLALAALEKDPLIRVAAGSLALVGVGVCLSGGGVIAACAGILALAAALSILANSFTQRLLAGLLVLGTALFIVLALPKLPRNNVEVLWRSITLYAQADSNSEVEKPTARLRRHQASLNFLRDNHWQFGGGSGNFQRAVNRYYTEPYAKPSRETDDETAWDMEADEKLSVGLWETTAVELGVPGVLLLGWVFATWLLSAGMSLSRLDAFSPEERDAAKLVALASLGACVGAMTFSIWGNPLARGCAGSFALFMGAALALQRQSRAVNEYR